MITSDWIRLLATILPMVIGLVVVYARLVSDTVAVKAKIEESQNYNKHRFDRGDKQMDSLDMRLGQVETKMYETNHIKSRVATTEAGLTDLAGRVRDICEKMNMRRRDSDD